jgi:hypothetical protein
MASTLLALLLLSTSVALASPQFGSSINKAPTTTRYITADYEDVAFTFGVALVSVY